MIEMHVASDKDELGRQAAALGAQAIRDEIARNGTATIIVATGASQFEMLNHLVATEGIDWSKVTAFHLDEYVGLSESHPASFRRYLRERFMAPLKNAPTFIPVDGEGDPMATVKQLNQQIAGKRIAVCFAGFGENCHLAFNDPPADSRPRSLISSSISMMLAASSSSARAGSRASTPCRSRRSR